MGVLMDLRYTLRLLRKSRGFTLLTLLVLAGGLTVSLFTFSFFYTMLYKPLPLPGDGGRGLLRLAGPIPLYEYAESRARLRAFAEFGVWRDAQVRLSAGEDSQTLFGTFAEWNLFDLSRARAALGRTLQAQDAEAGAPAVAVISHGLWQRHFAGDPGVIGRTLRLDERDVEVVGVMPRGYGFPVSTEVWQPLSRAQLNPTSDDLSMATFHCRLAPASTRAAAEQELEAALRGAYEARARQRGELVELGPDTFRLDTYQVTQLGGGVIVDLAMYGINVVSTLILLLASINVGNLLLARAASRAKESAVRVALGAEERRLVGQLMWEGGLIVVAGTACALALVAAALSAMTLFLQSAFGRQGAPPFWWTWSLDVETLLAALAFMGLTLFTVCYLPARRSARADVTAELRDGTRGAQGLRTGRFMRALVTGQIMVVSLIMAFGLLVFSLVRKGERIDPGYDLRNLMGADVTLPPNPENAQTVHQLLTGLQAEGLVDEASAWTPLGNVPVVVEGLDSQASLPAVSLYQLLTLPEFHTLPLVEGRYFDDRERVAADRVDLASALVSRSFAAKRWRAGESALGKRLQVTLGGPARWYTVVGVLGDVTQTFSEAPDATDEVYLSAFQTETSSVRVQFRYKDNANLAEESFYRTLRRQAPQARAAGVRNVAEALGMSRRVMSVGQHVLFTCGAFALLLSLCGVYAITSNAIVEKMHEVGIRRALGATDREVVQLFLRQSMWQVLIGLGFGLGCAAAFGWLGNSFFGFALGFYLEAFAVVTLTVGVIVALAVVVPGRRAALVEPSVALRTE